MSFWEFRQWIESHVPWWAPFAAVLSGLIFYGLAWLLARLTQCRACAGTGIMEGDPTAPANSISRHDVPCPECRPDA